MAREYGQKRKGKMNFLWRGLIEVGFIVFLFYSNLLMGEFVNGGMGQSNGLWWAVQNIVTETTFIIAVVSGLIGYLVVEFLRNKLQ